MTESFVHQYIWQDYSLETRKNWILTLSDNEAIVLLAFVTTLLAYTQTRVWKIGLEALRTLLTPKIQLPGEDKISSITQGAAIGILFESLRKKRQGHQETMGKTSPWIGLFAVMNMLGFVILGIVLPWSLSGGR